MLNVCLLYVYAALRDEALRWLSSAARAFGIKSGHAGSDAE